MSEIREKYVMIKLIVEKFHNKICPYCDTPTVEYFDGESRKIGCGECDIQVEDGDYYWAIDYIVKNGDFKPKNKFKKLGEF